MDVDAYLARIGYRGSLSPTARALRDLQLAHLMTVPFENLSIRLRQGYGETSPKRLRRAGGFPGEPIVLDDAALFDKIVRRHRGGFCYEANGLFAALLRRLGFEVAMLSAEVARPDGSYSQPFDHMALLVTLDERWLVDVGFGDTFREPLRIDERGEQRQGGRGYRILPDEEGLVLSQRDGDGPWVPQYRFTLQSFTYAGFAAMCHYHQTSPESHFTQNRICTRATPDGRVTLSGMRLITTSGRERVERALETQAEYDRVLWEQFGIRLERAREQG